MQKIKGIKGIYGERLAKLFQVDVLNADANHACLWRTKQIFASTRKPLMYFILHFIIFFSARFGFFFKSTTLIDTSI